MARPNLFIIGAPKCGTTSLAHWLGDHPNIFMSPVKEPHYFNTDDARIQQRSFEEYEALFADANTNHTWIGEASVWYLHSQIAVSQIEQYSPGSRFVVCLRNPIEMAPALHEQQVANGNEHLTFDDAWRANERRSKGASPGVWCTEDPRHLAYGPACLLGLQLQRLFTKVPRERVHLVFLDDVREDPRKAYLQVLTFLGLADDGRTSFEIHNPAKAVRSPTVTRVTKVLGAIKRRLRIRWGLGVLDAISQGNLRYRKRAPLRPGHLRELQEYFASDIALLAHLTQRDLDSWNEQ